MTSPASGVWVRGLGLVPWLAAAVLIAAFGGVQPQWYLPVFAALFLAAGVELWLPGPRPARAAWWLAGLLALPLFQLAVRSTADAVATQTEFLEILAAVAAFGLVWRASARDRGYLDRLLSFAAIGGAFLAAAAIVQSLASPAWIWGVHHVAAGTPVGSFVNHNDFAACMELLLPAGLAMALLPHRTAVRAGAWAFAPALMIAAVVLSASRGGAFAVAVELAAFSLLLLRRHPGGGRIGLAVALLVIAFSLAVGVGPLWQRLGHSEVDAATRVNLDVSSLQMGMDRPWLGWGLGAWPAVYPRFARFDNGLRFGFAHDEYAQWWAESGLVGTILLLALALALAAAWRRAPELPRDSHPPEARALAALAASPPAADRLRLVAFRIAAAAFLLHAGIDFLFHIPALLTTFAVIAAAGVTALPPRPTGWIRARALATSLAATPTINHESPLR
ncbi:MAG: O-antigen ligase family protein [Terriglobales bacterium]